MSKIDFLVGRGVALAGPVIAGCLLLVGCGGSSHPAPRTHTSTKPAKPPAGAVLAAGVTKAMATNQPQLKGVKLDCPSAKGYPVKCPFTATEVITHPKKTLHMAGTITVTGASGGSYSYGLNDAPVH